MRISDWSSDVCSSDLAGSDLKSTKHYDQIAFMARPGRFGTSGKAGVFDFQKSVFGRDQLDRYLDLVDPAYFISKNGKAKNPTTVYNDWRTHQMSDHLLLWSELRINFSEEYLRDLAAPVGCATRGKAVGFHFLKSVYGRDQLDRHLDRVDPAYFISKNGKAKNPTTVYNDWRTHQMSDHLLLGSELRINFSEEYLRDMAAPVVM